jgi:modification methylase
MLHRVLLASTAPEDVVLDPFSGTGTTAVVAKKLNRRFIGIERHPAYVEAAWARLAQTRRLETEALAVTPSRRDTPRIAFGSLVESGALSAGTILFDRQRRVSAVVGPDGSVSAGELRGSIHKVGAEVQNAPSCNGWTFWHFWRDGKLVPIDVLRRL